MDIFFWRKRQNRQEQLAQAPKRWAWLGGRRMLTNTPYILPKDPLEGDRLDLQHHLLKIAIGRNYYAPIRQPQAILDVACGTGIWGREMAQEFKRAQVIGFDIDRTPLDRALERLGPGGQFPPNFSFQVADALKPFPFEDERFDFVHSRLIAGFVPWQRWPDVVAEMARVTRRGGYVELVESTGQSSASPGFNRIYEATKQLTYRRGIFRPDGSPPDIAGYLRQAGVQHVQQREIILGTGPQAARQQRLIIADVLAAYGNLGPILTSMGLLTSDEFHQALEAARWELPQMGITMSIVFTFGIRL